jgi:hypothetical protein
MTESIADLDLADALLKVMLTPDQSIADLSNACGWRTSSGDPDKSKVQRILKRLERDKLVTIKRGGASLTEAGKAAASGIKAAEDHLATLKAIDRLGGEFDEHEVEFGRAAVAMLAAGYTPDRCRWMVTCAMLAFRQMTAVQARRDALRVVDGGAVQS